MIKGKVDATFLAICCHHLQLVIKLIELGLTCLIVLYFEVISNINYLHEEYRVLLVVISWSLGLELSKQFLHLLLGVLYIFEFR